MGGTEKYQRSRTAGALPKPANNLAEKAAAIVGNEAADGEEQKQHANGEPGTAKSEDDSHLVQDSGITGVIPPQTALATHASCSASISDPETVSGGLFSQKFTVFAVATSPLGWNVKRRYSDFLWLRQQLMAMYPGYYIPPLPEKK